MPRPSLAYVPVIALSDAEKVKIRHHTGYLNVQEASTFVLGVPAAVETQFIIEGAMNRVMEAALGEVRRHLQILDSLEEQGINDHELLAVRSLGEIEVDDREHPKLDRRYDRWVASLCNLLGVIRNPFDARLAGGPGINVRVV